MSVIEHVDIVKLNWHDGTTSLIRRTDPDDPTIGEQVRTGWASYVAMSEPHTMADCPFGPYVSTPSTEPTPLIVEVAACPECGDTWTPDSHRPFRCEYGCKTDPPFVKCIALEQTDAR